jgi:large subunit ribosomal protein L1|tara:strand:- start:470 stop:1348 length:879 start_codon:yes stop_codon:yes gene_type:complete
MAINSSSLPLTLRNVGGKMDKELIASTLKKVKENSPKKNFKQSVDLIINLKGLDLKKAEHQINMFITLQHDTGKKISICALVGPELESGAKEACDQVILQDEFDGFKGKAEAKKLANKHDFFIAQASVMAKIATIFGRFLGPKGKMPNPKIGSVLPPNGDVKALTDKLRKTVNLATKNEATIKCLVGKEDSNEGIIDNVLTVYNSVVQKIPNEKQNVKSVLLKLTMGPAFVVGKEDEKDGKKKGKKAETEATEKPKQKTEKKEAKQEKKTEEKAVKKQTPTKNNNPKNKKSA